MTYRLYHYSLSPFCRKLRLVLSEKKVQFELIEERYWEKRHDFLRMCPEGKVPFLRGDNKKFSDSQATCEYIDSVYPEPLLMVGNAYGQYEIRRLVKWFDEKFHQEVTSKLLGERVLRRVQGLGPIDAANIASGRQCLRFHLDYMNHLLEKRKWLAGDYMSLADFAAAAHISCLDFIGDMSWEEEPLLKEEPQLIKEWYAKIKSRPSFQPLLGEFLPNIPPPPDCYSDLDF